jgi:methionyl-tRNA formyltransferase
MRIAFFTSEFEFGEQSLPALIHQGEKIVAAVMPPAQNRRALNIQRVGAESQIPVYSWESIKQPDVIHQIKTWRADLAVSAGNMRYIFGREFLQSFTLGAINFHASLLPKNGGACPIHWQIYKGEDLIGMTIHYCAEGIDTGDVILQESVSLGPDDTFKGIYFGRVLPKSVELLSRAVRLIREGNAPRIRQELSQSTYNPPFTEAHAAINWDEPASKIYNTIRACDAWPGARTTYRGKMFTIWQAKKVNAVAPDLEPGTITEIKGNGFVINASDGSILVERVQLDGAPKQMVNEFLTAHDLKIGERLGASRTSNE